ncbi:hypothetical protein FQN54_009968 [Arachnomyces sp. PD_36]|nr:hypothetical protein FQN54_009968 [Arachnomyces sp. PD_36]
MAETSSLSQSRSSSLASSSSRKSPKAKTLRAKGHKRLSAASSNTPTDLTSFPSLTPDSSPEGFRGEPALNHALSQALLEEATPAPERERGRKATLAGLTTSLPLASGRASLFEDSVPSKDVPGALHLANDDHIERVIARTGAVKLVRQFARDLALRDAEISALRLRADERERELKKMLREMEVSNHDIEHRLYVLENPAAATPDGADYTDSATSGQTRKPSSRIDDMMSEAMMDGVGARVYPESTDGCDGDDVQATLKAHRNECDTKSGSSSGRSADKKAPGSIRGWQDYIFGSVAGSRKTSRASSTMSEVPENSERNGMSRIPSSTSNRRKALDDDLFLPPDANGKLDAADGVVKAPSEAASIQSRKSTRSLGAWTVRLFAGNPQAGKETKDQDGVKSTPPSEGQDKPKSRTSTISSAQKPGGSAVAALRRINSNAGFQTLPKHMGPPANTQRSKLRMSRSNGTSTPRSETNTETTQANSDATNLGPVEMDAILPAESRPPTLTHIYDNYIPGELLTDRFGFIYDQRRKKRQREATGTNSNSKRMSMTETISSFRSDIETGNDDTVAEIQPPSDTASESQARPLSPTSAEDPENATPTRKWQDYLKIATRPTELLSHTPSAAPIVTLTTGSDVKAAAPSVAVDKSGSLSVNSNSQPSASTSPIQANAAEFAGASISEIAKIPASEQEPVKLLLEQLTDLHDSLQRERTAKWNDFLRKVRAERRKEGEAAAAIVSDRSNRALDMPEALLADGEVVGIAGLGNKGKVGRAKWREFKSLVLGGIPVAHRAKIWSECSGANALRVPGYYDELINGSKSGDSDPSITSQIKMDIHRTLTDNVFFRKGPGVAKLSEVLLAYSRRNPEVGYCQGMNLIAGSLLLIMPTAEDVFWVMTSLIENILPQHYYDHGLLASRADQQVLRQYVTELLPKLSAHLDDLGIELEALTFQWFLSVFTDCLSAEALYRVWDVIFCLSASTMKVAKPGTTTTPTTNPSAGNTTTTETPSPTVTATTADGDISAPGGGSSIFLFQVALALLKLNEQQLLTTCSTPAALYTYINHQMTNHAISIDGLIQASEALRNVVRREDVLSRRANAISDIENRGQYRGSESGSVPGS